MPWRKRETGLQRASRKREERLEEIRLQEESGRLVIRQATAAERERYGIRTPPRGADG